MIESSRNSGGRLPALGAGLRGCRLAGWAAIAACCPVIPLKATDSNWPGALVPLATNVAQARRLASRPEAVECAIRLEGVVVWTSPGQDQWILQDDAGAIRVDWRDQPPVQAGQRVRLEGNGLAGSGILREVLVDNDGLHPAAEKSGTIYLAAGRHPIRADWFNGPALFELEVEYEGPGMPRQRIPDPALFRVDRSKGTARLVNGLDYRCYEGNWDRLPDFQRLVPVKAGAASNFDLRVRTRDEEAGLQFTGYLAVPREGPYTFWTKSDDGSRLFVGEASLRLSVLGSGPLATPRRIVPGQLLHDADEGQWAEVEGTVTSIHADPSGALQVEVSSGSNHLFADLEHATGAVPARLSRIRATGIFQGAGSGDNARVADRLLVPDAKQIEVLAAPPDLLSPGLNQVAQLRRLASTSQGILCPVRLAGLVLSANPGLGRLAFQDASGAALVEMDWRGQDVRPGQKVVLAGNCVVGGTRVTMCNPALVDNDGLHGMLEQSGAIYLNAGKHPIHLSWFNRLSPSGLEVYYQGPDLPRQRVPDSALYRLEWDAGGNSPRWINGLDYRCYEGTWLRVPNSNLLTPVRQGNTANFAIGVASRTEDVGLEFSGFVEVPRAGVYTFTTISDDGSRLFVDEQPPQLQVVGTNALPVPQPIAARQFLREDQQNRWSQVEGTVTFVSEESGALELELSSGNGRMRVEVVDGSGGSPLLLLNSRIRARGICQSTYTTDGQQVAGALLAPSLRQIEVLEVASTLWDDYPVCALGAPALTNRSQTAEPIIHLRGQVRSATPGESLLVADATGQILVETTQPPPPEGGQVEVLGRWSRTRTNVLLRSGFYREIPSSARADLNRLPLLTTVEQVKRLSREEAQRGYPVKIRGVITAPQIGGFFIQDSTWAIYARLRDAASMELPRVGDYCEVEGVTFAEFAPNVRAHRLVRLGAGTLPEPLRPTWDQLINGSLDTQYVEVQGIVTAVEADGLVLLTRAGKIKVQLSEADPQSLKPYQNALIRIRGCVIPGRDSNTQQVELGRMRLSNFSVNLDEPAPVDPFATPLKRASDLLLFDPRAGAIQRVKIAGQVLSEHGGEYFLMEGTNGLRFIPRAPVELQAGDLVEVVGFPELGGPSPVLREAMVRPTGKASLPAALPLPADALVSRRHDATRVRIEARLASVSLEQADQVLVCQAGTREFVARLETRRGLLRGLRPGSRLELTGVYAGRGGDPASGWGIKYFELLLNSPADLRVLEQPSWWTLPRLLTALGMMAVVLLAATLWAFTLKRRVDAQTEVIRQKAEREATLEERARIARELHDTLEQALAGISLQLNALATTRREMPAESLRILEMTRSMVRHGQEEAQRTVRNLRVFALEKGDLPAALAELAAQSRHDLRLDIEAHTTGAPQPLPAKVEGHLLRIGQEATTNAIKHARAKTIRLELGYDGGRVQLFIRDDGCGFDAERAAPSEAGHFGLLGMRERAEKIGGTLQVLSAPGKGTTVQVTVPLPPLPPGSGKRNEEEDSNLNRR